MLCDEAAENPTAIFDHVLYACVWALQDEALASELIREQSRRPGTHRLAVDDDILFREPEAALSLRLEYVLHYSASNVLKVVWIRIYSVLCRLAINNLELEYAIARVIYTEYGASKPS